MKLNDNNDIKNILKNKKIIFAGWNVERKDDSPYQNWYLPLRDLFGRVILFDTAKLYFRCGRKAMNEQLLALIKREKPDYVFFLLIYDEINPLLFKEIKKASPDTITLNMFTDDDWRYDDFSRFYALLIDYPIVNITDKDMDKSYKKDGINHLSLSLSMNCKLFKPMEIKKEYNVSFIGRPNKSRVDYIKYLLNKRVSVKVWGDGWENYPEISEAFMGRANAEEIVVITNKSRINLSFTKGGYGKMQMKGRIFEISACKSFSLIEYFDVYKRYFKENKEIIMFKDKKDLLDKIKYYLRDERKRENIAIASYNKTLRDYNKHKEILEYFKNILDNEEEILNKEKFEVKAKTANIGIGENNTLENLKRIVKEADYISFTGNGSIAHPMKTYLQIYSLKKSGKEISCCDYYVSNGILKNILLFKAKQSSVSLNRGAFKKCLFLQQIVVKKEFFLENISKFMSSLSGEELSIIDDKNTSFVSIPLVEINNFPKLDYNDFKKAFQMKFLDTLYSLYYQNKLFFSSYFYFLIFNALFKNKPMLKAIKENLSDRKKLTKLKKGI